MGANLGWFEDFTAPVRRTVSDASNNINRTLSEHGNNINREGSILGNNINREADTPGGKALIGGLVGGPAGAAIGFGLGGGLSGLFGGGQQSPSGPGADFSKLTNKWYGLADQQTGQLLQNQLDTQAKSANSGLATATGNLAQRGGLSAGSGERLQRAGMWDQLQAGADAAQKANMAKTSLYQQGIKDLELPIMQGQDMQRAQMDAANRLRSSDQNGALLGLIGGGVGAYFGGPAGAGVGSQIGSGLGRSYG